MKAHLDSPGAVRGGARADPHTRLSRGRGAARHHFLDAERREARSRLGAWLETLPGLDSRRGRAHRRGARLCCWEARGAGYLTLEAICAAVEADPPLRARDRRGRLLPDRSSRLLGAGSRGTAVAVLTRPPPRLAHRTAATARRHEPARSDFRTPAASRWWWTFDGRGHHGDVLRGRRGPKASLRRAGAQGVRARRRPAGAREARRRALRRRAARCAAEDAGFAARLRSAQAGCGYPATLRWSAAAARRARRGRSSPRRPPVPRGSRHRPSRQGARSRGAPAAH